MDTYGIINLSELDRMIEHHKKIVMDNVEHDLILLHAARLAAIIEIKDLCLKHPTANDTFRAGWEQEEGETLHSFCPKYEDFEDYINQFIKSDKP